MRKTIIAGVLLGLTAPAAAQDYQFVIARKQTCDFTGERAYNAFNLKRQGLDMQVITKEDSGLAYPIYKYAVEYGYNTALTQEDAYLHSWAKCMDNFEWALKYYKNHKRIAEHLHY
jgi:hypothetical protein